MALRDLAGGAARLNAGFWREVAQTVDPKPQRREHEPEPPPDALPAPEASQSVAASPTDEGMLVPIDTWTRVLEQRGNLHQAGQDLAEARERAAKAETEAAFLREQLAAARAAAASDAAVSPKRTRRAPASEPEPETEPGPMPTAAPAAVSPAATVVGTRTGARLRVVRVRSRVSEWIRPGSDSSAVDG